LRKEVKMDNLLVYLLKVSIVSMVAYLSYKLFFSRDTFYLRNRIFLILILVLSIIIPLLKIFNLPASNETTVSTNGVNALIISGTHIQTNVSEKIISFDFYNLLVWLYFLIAGIILFRGLISVTRTYTIIRKGTVLDIKFPKLIISDIEHPPFSFFPYVVIPRRTYESGDYLELLEHENTHIRQGHTFDLLLSELLIAFQWFNPFMWLIKRSIVLNHEYLADNFSLKVSNNIKAYQYRLLNIQANLNIVPLAHNFSSLIKYRLVMINKKPSHNYAALKNILIIPIVAILFLMFSFKTASNPPKSVYQEPLFSKTSVSAIYKFINQNIVYPQMAKESSDIGKVFVVVKMNKGGVIKECKAFTDTKDIKSPILDEVVITAYNTAGQSVKKSEKGTAGEHPFLKNECVRIAKKLSEIDIPEWKEKNMEFALSFNFILK
jgi:beta-lactamase regulating signal transducer with metallopeptidase domain